MPFATLDGIPTRYEVFGSGPPLLMFSPGGFDATVEKWSTQSVYATIKLLDHLPRNYTCIAYDRRETGQSGGRVERVAWRDYAVQGKKLLEHLGVERAHVIGGCMGCSVALAFAVAYPQATRGAILYWPVGGPRYRLNGHARFGEHLAYVQRHTLADVVALVAEGRKAFGADPRGGPWASVIARDPEFARAYAAFDPERYRLIVASMARTLFDRDTAPGAEPEDLMRLDVPALVVPGRDASHATSAARYLDECFANSEYVDLPPEAQTEDVIPPRLLGFLDAH
ncbi:MAG TPA: alpha/beta hydrolase [Candidatus Elarobacter sp.]|jgi:pimeloyl-ACP methyl ester carboxylesterase|nr:alpha/beta hydrolase [Candidatus Elarobacter sp.]